MPVVLTLPPSPRGPQSLSLHCPLVQYVHVGQCDTAAPHRAALSLSCLAPETSSKIRQPDHSRRASASEGSIHSLVVKLVELIPRASGFIVKTRRLQSSCSLMSSRPWLTLAPCVYSLYTMVQDLCLCLDMQSHKHLGAL